MKYKLINRKTGEETLCDKVTIDGFDYYVDTSRIAKPHEKFINELISPEQYLLKPIIATTNNSNIDIPKVVDEVEMLANIEYPFAFGGIGNIENTLKNHFIKGYNKSQETHTNSDENMKLFGKFCTEYDYRLFGTKSYEELLQLWKEQKPKTLYYE